MRLDIPEAATVIQSASRAPARGARGARRRLSSRGFVERKSEAQRVLAGVVGKKRGGGNKVRLVCGYGAPQKDPLYCGARTAVVELKTEIFAPYGLSLCVGYREFLAKGRN